VTECTRQARNAQAKFRDSLKQVVEKSDHYESEVATARVECRNTHLITNNTAHALAREERIQKEIKRRENKQSTQQSFRKICRHIRGHINPNSLKKSSLTRLEVQDCDAIWKKIQGKVPVEEHIVERNVEQFSHVGNTPFGYTPLGGDLGHTGDSMMAEEILDGTIEHESLIDETIHAIITKLRQHLVIQKIIKPVVIVADFNSAFNHVPENTQSASVHAAMLDIPLATGFYPQIQFNIIYFNCAFSKLIFPKEGNITLSTMPVHMRWDMARLSHSCSPSESPLDIAVSSRYVGFYIIQVYFIEYCPAFLAFIP
jgi:transcription termination factor NusB